MTDESLQPGEPAAPDANTIPDANALAAEAAQPEPKEADPSPAAPQEGEAPEKPKGVQKRLDELTRNWREAQRQNEALLRILESQGKTPEQRPEPVAPKTLADFNYDETQYQAHLMQQATQQAVEAAKRELQAQAQREREIRRQQTFAQKQAEFAETVEDYRDVVFNESLPITPAMAEVIQESDDGPALAYHLGKNPDLAARIAALPPIAAAREMGRLEARLSAEKEKAKAPVVSKAPPPVPKIEAVEPALNIRPDDPASDALDIREWVKKRDKQEAKRHG